MTPKRADQPNREGVIHLTGIQAAPTPKTIQEATSEAGDRMTPDEFRTDARRYIAAGSLVMIGVAFVLAYVYMTR
jgi:hypothetical protein